MVFPSLTMSFDPEAALNMRIYVTDGTPLGIGSAPAAPPAPFAAAFAISSSKRLQIPVGEISRFSFVRFPV